MHNWIEAIIRRLKGDASYTLDKDISIFDLLSLLLYRGSAVLRGVWMRPQLKKASGLLFLGKNVTLRHKQKISAGRSNIIEDFVYIDALSRHGVILGNNVTIAKFTTIQCTGVIQELGEGLEIGDNSAIGAYSFLGAQGGIKIGSNVIMGPKVGIHAENHNFQDRNIPIRLQKTSRKGIVIEDNCWIGASSTIVDGVHIHQGCVVAAGSVVTKDVPPHTLVAGVPARVLKNLGEDQTL
ncbi:MAG TPA: acyltransferase [Anaerolineales bacterium]|nr:acyltransferase [Anaerolineales bacterium]